MKKTYRSFRKIALAEGISFLVLLFIAMPMKYMASLPMAVTIAGGLHGMLFIAFLIMMWEVRNEFKRDWPWTGKALLASILPFGTIVMDKEWKKEEARAAQG
jgi:integral membrane protein